MGKCSCYIKNRYSDGFGYCMGTKDRDMCTCQGDESNCDYYPEKRNKKMTTLEMMIEANDNNKTYRVDDMLYNAKLGFHDELGKKWYGDAFEYLNELFEVDSWQEDDTIYMTKAEAEKKYGIKIVEQ